MGIIKIVSVVIGIYCLIGLIDNWIGEAASVMKGEEFDSSKNQCASGLLMCVAIYLIMG